MQLCFEELRPVHLPLLLGARLLGWHITAFDHNLQLRTRPLIGWLARRGWVRRLVTWSWGSSHTDAIDLADYIVDRMNAHPAIVAAAQLYGSDEVRLVFKRCLAERLARTFEIAERFRRDALGGQLGPTLLVAGKVRSDIKLMREHGWQGQLMPHQVKLLSAGDGWAAAARFARLVRVLLAALLRMLCQTQRRAAHHVKQVSIGWGISSGFQTRFQGVRRFDFAIDEVDLKSADILFLVEASLNDTAMAAIHTRRRAVMDISEIASVRSFLWENMAGEWIGRAIRSLPTFLRTAAGEEFLTDAVQACVSNYLYWNAVRSKVRFDQYVCTNKEHPSQIAACVLLRSYGVKTIAYSQWIGGPYQFKAPYDESNVIWSFLNFDMHLINNAAMRDSFRRHKQSVRRYEIVGNLFSELIAGRRKARQPPEVKTVAIFDTTFIDEPNFFTNLDDYKLFLSDLIRLATTRCEIKFVFKPSKATGFFVEPSSAWNVPENGGGIVALQRKYADLPNVEFFGHEQDPAEVIADADLVITHCFSSPTADALAAGIPAIWYGSTNKYQDFPLAQLRGAHVYGYEALIGAIDELLAGRGVAWEDPRFPEMVDPFSDRGALTRMRRLLQQNSSQAG